MNEKIKALINQAADEYQTTQLNSQSTMSNSKMIDIATVAKDAGISVIPNKFLELFAVMIVNECAKFQETREVRRHGYNKHGDGVAMKKIFGISLGND